MLTIFTNIEASVFYFLNHTLANPVFDAAIKLFMQFTGKFAIVLIGVIALFFGKKHLKISAMVFLSAYVISRYVFKAIKFFVQRPRPFHSLDDVRLLMGTHEGFSFPSGHATTSFCLATVVAMRYPKLRWPAYIAAALVALSRPYLGVHYPTDILAGSMLGAVIGYLVTKTANRCFEQSSA